jgi:hypothetical protein
MNTDNGYSDAMLNYQNRDGGVFGEEREFRPGVQCWNDSCCDVSGSQSARHAVDSALPHERRAAACALACVLEGLFQRHLWTLDISGPCGGEACTTVLVTC